MTRLSGSVAWLALGLFPSPAWGAEAQSNGGEVAELRAKITQLEDRIDSLQADSGEKWLTERRATEIRSLVQDVLSDADSRSSLQGSGMTAGYDKGFFLASTDGNFKLKIGGVIQLRYVFNHADGLLSQGGTNWAGLQSVADSNFGAFDFYNPDLTVTGVGTFNPTAVGGVPGATRFALYNNAGLMYALGFSQAERAALLAEIDNPAIAGFQPTLTFSPGERGDLDRATALFISQRIDSLTPAQRNAFAAALGRTITSSDGVGPVPVSGFAHQGNSIEFSDFQAYSQFLGGLYERQLRAQSNGDANRQGFEMRRVQITFGGHVINPSWQYYIMGEFSRDGGAFLLQDAWIRHDFGGGWSVKAGQYKAPLLREELVSDSFHQTVERSLVNSMFSARRAQGVSAEYSGDVFHAVAMLNDGAQNISNGQASINVPWQTEHFEGLGATGRLEWLAMGTWDQFKGVPSFQGDPMGIMLGAAAHYDKEEFGTGGFAPGSEFRPRTTAGFNNSEVETFTATADASIDFGGANLFGAFVYRNLQTDGPFIKQIVAGRNTFDQDQFGFVVQGGVFLASDWEVFARYEWATADLPDIRVGGVSVYSFDDLSLVTFGVNKYFGNPGNFHQIKWQLDFGLAFDRVEFFAADTGAGWRNQTGGTDDTQFVIRSQLQLIF